MNTKEVSRWRAGVARVWGRAEKAWNTGRKSCLRTGRLAAGWLLLWGTGCDTVESYSLTYRLWEGGEWRKFSQPAPDPKLTLFQGANRAEVLVQYDALSERHETVERRAFYLRQNEERVAAGKEPRWVKPSVTEELNPIRVLPRREAVATLPAGGMAFAVLTHEGHGFTLCRPPGPEATFDLPVYAETSGAPTHLVLTPFAVVGDTVMVGAVASVIGFLLWVQMGAPTP